MSDRIIDQAKLIVLQLLPPGVHTAQEIEEQVGYVVPMLRSRYPGVDIDVERIINELQDDLNIFQPDSVSIDDDRDHEEWLLELQRLHPLAILGPLSPATCASRSTFPRGSSTGSPTPLKASCGSLRTPPGTDRGTAAAWSSGRSNRVRPRTTPA